MQNVDNLVQATGLIHNFFIDGTAPLPDDFKAKLRELLFQYAPGPVQARLILELIYARKADLPKEMLQIGLQFTQTMVNYQQLGYQNGRGQGIVGELLAMPGVKPTEKPLPPEAPKPDPQFMPGDQSNPEGWATPATTAPAPLVEAAPVVPSSPQP